MATTLDSASSGETQDHRRPAKWFLAALGLLAGLAIGAGALLAAGVWRIGPPELHGMVIQSPRPVSNFTLLGPGDEPVSLRDFRGRTVLLYFGYTYCPDVCPATLAELKQTMAFLGEDAEDIQVLMISVDPERDSPASLQEYVTHFHPSFIGLTGQTENDILAVTTPLGVYYEKHEGSPATGYLIDHTATLSVIDKDGYLRLVYPFGVSGSDIAADLDYIMKD